MKKNFRRGQFLISADKSKLDIKVVHDFISNSYWAKGRQIGTMKRAIKNSLCFGLYKRNRQIGFGRVITDSATYAYIADVFILEEFRGLGLSKWMMQVILEYPELKGIRRWFLATKDAHGLYKKFGFRKLKNPDRLMELSKR